MKPRVIIFIYFGGPILHFVKCYSNGNFDNDPDICQTMEVRHGNNQPQDTEPPFKVDPDNITVDLLDVGKSIDVTLKADSGETFRGFMLEARKSGNPTPQGIFSLLDPNLSRLQQCDGINGKAVTQTNNQRKAEVKVKWNVSETGVYFFRATFVKSYSTFWLASSTPVTTSTPAPVTTTTVMTSTSAISTSPSPSTSTPTSTSTTLSSDPVTTTTVMISTSTISTSTSTASTSTSTTLSSVTTTAPPQTFLFESSLTLHLLSYLSLAECGLFLMKTHVCAWMKVTSFLSLAFSLAAFILLLIDNKQVEGKILAGVAASLNLCQTILIFFLCGPSHELRKIFCWVLRVVASINFCFTIAAIYVGLVEDCSKNPCFWPAILMGVYLACQLLSCPFFLYGILKQKNRQQTASSKQNCRVSYWCTCLVIFSGMNIAFTIALVLGIFLCHCTTDT
ncbi:hypothetical protein PHYPO_G00232050 [Pangasianodon hypophthalmus]|uniref:Reelin domain-containing protein n=1 Tax=Pangasianodon hypophthalmus TaxID=310915 RepID=A0A5N5NIP9_PANHP|nr:hypothetical protein PHYPO_G00232050 [Pangasianodon hypophthalmus]